MSSIPDPAYDLVDWDSESDEEPPEIDPSKQHKCQAHPTTESVPTAARGKTVASGARLMAATWCCSRVPL